jgi:anti-sigma factor RsiW
VTLRCEECAVLLSAFIDGELDATDRFWVEEHLASCGGCRERKALLEAQRDAIRSHVVGRAARADLSAVTSAVLKRVAVQRASPPLSVRGRELWWAHRRRVPAVAAIALAASVAAVVLLRPSGIRPPVEAPSRAQIASVDEVDFAGRPGIVLQLGQTAIIWLSQERSDQ